MMTYPTRISIILLLALSTTTQASSENLDTSLQSQIEILRMQIDELRTRIEVLENQLSYSSPSTEQHSASPWEALRSGMKPAEVKALLGAPLRRQGGGVELWFYSEAGKAGPFVKFVFGSLQSWRAPGGESIRSR